jgi:hypothetical protein
MRERGTEREGNRRGPGEEVGPSPLCLPPAQTVNDDLQNLFKKHWEQELEDRRKAYR